MDIPVPVKKYVTNAVPIGGGQSMYWVWSDNTSPTSASECKLGKPELERDAIRVGTLLDLIMIKNGRIALDPDIGTTRLNTSPPDPEEPSPSLNTSPVSVDELSPRLKDNQVLRECPQINLSSPLPTRKPRAVRTDWKRHSHSCKPFDASKYKVLAYLKSQEDALGRGDVSDTLMISLNTGIRDCTLKTELLRWSVGFSRWGWHPLVTRQIVLTDIWVSYGYRLTGWGRAWIENTRNARNEPRIWDNEVLIWKNWASCLDGKSRYDIRRALDDKLKPEVVSDGSV